MQRVDPIAAVTQALNIKFQDLAGCNAGLDPAAFCMFREEVLVLGIQPDGQGHAVIALGHSETPFAALSLFMRFRYAKVNNLYNTELRNRK